MTSDNGRNRQDAAAQDAAAGDGLDLDLPFFVTGRLPAGETEALRARLASDPEARRRLALVQEERAAAVMANEAIAPPSLAAMEALFAKIDVEEAAAPVRRPQPAAAAPQARGWLGRTFAALFAGAGAPRWPGFAVAGLAALAVIESGALLHLLGRQAVQDGGRYVAASAPEKAAGPTALVRFAPGVSMADAGAWLAANGMRVADGPLPGDMWRLQAPGADAQDMLRRLGAAGAPFAAVVPENGG